MIPHAAASSFTFIGHRVGGIMRGIMNVVLSALIVLTFAGVSLSANDDLGTCCTKTCCTVSAECCEH